jgi:hypothetical protein
MKAVMPRVPAAGVSLGEHAIEARPNAAVADPGLFVPLMLITPGVAVLHVSYSLSSQPASEPALASLRANAAIFSPLATARKVGGLLLPVVPASVIAPLPRPCIANAKSAKRRMEGQRLAQNHERAGVQLAPARRQSAAGTQ